MVEFNRLYIDGSLGGGVERFSVGIAYADAAGGDAVQGPSLSSWANDSLAAFGTATWGSTLKALLGSNGAVDRVRTYLYPAPGESASAVGVSSGPPITGANSITMPPQCSLVFSLVTGIPGRRTRGRMYWPCVTGTLSAGFKRSGTPSQQSVADAARDMLADLGQNLVPPIDVVPVVVSVAGDLVTAVTQVQVGDVVDTQRRRRDALAEVRVSATLP